MYNVVESAIYAIAKMRPEKYQAFAGFEPLTSAIKLSLKAYACLLANV